MPYCFLYFTTMVEKFKAILPVGGKRFRPRNTSRYLRCRWTPSLSAKDSAVHFVALCEFFLTNETDFYGTSLNSIFIYIK